MYIIISRDGQHVPCHLQSFFFFFFFNICDDGFELWEVDILVVFFFFFRGRSYDGGLTVWEAGWKEVCSDTKLMQENNWGNRDREKEENK